MPLGDQGFRALPPSLDPRLNNGNSPERNPSSPTLASSKARVALENLRTSMYQQGSSQPTILTPRDREPLITPNTMGSISSFSEQKSSYDGNNNGVYFILYFNYSLFLKKPLFKQEYIDKKKRKKKKKTAEVGRLSHIILQHQESIDRLSAQKHDIEDQLSGYRVKYDECETSNTMLLEKIESLTRLMHEVCYL